MYQDQDSPAALAEFSEFPFQIQPRLTQIFLAVTLKGGIAEMVFPRLKAPGTLFAYTTDEVGEALRLLPTLLGGTARPGQFEVGATDTTGRTLPWGIEGLVPIENIKAAAAQGSKVDPMARATVRGANYLIGQREVRARDLLDDDSNFVSANIQTLASSGDRWNGTGDARSQILAAADAMLVPPNVLICNSQVWLALRQNPSIVESITHSGAGDSAKGVAQMRAVADLLELDKICVARAKVNTAKPGQAADFTRLWTDDFAVLAYINPNATTVDSGEATYSFTAEWQPRRVITYLRQGDGYEGVQCVKPIEHLVEVVSFKQCAWKFKTPVG